MSIARFPVKHVFSPAFFLLLVFLFSGSVPPDSRPASESDGLGASQEKTSEFRAPVIREDTAPPPRKKTPVLLIVGAAVGVGALVAILVLGKPKPANIQVNSTPAGAKVFLDGTDTGKTTNCLLEDVSVGNRSIKLVKDGYIDYSETVNAVAGQTAAVNAVMTKNTVVVTQPAASEAWVKGFTQAEIRWTVDGGQAALNAAGTFSKTMSPALHQQRRIARLMERERGTAMDRDSLTGARGTSDTDGARAAYQARGAARPSSGDARDQSGGISRPGSGHGDSAGSFPAGLAGIRTSPGADDVLRSGDAESTAALLAIVKVKIELYKGSVVAATIAEEADNTGGFSWPVPDTLTDGDDYRIRVSCSTDAGVYGESPNFTISSASLIITFPSASAVLGRGLNHNVTWTSNLPGENVKIELFKGETLNAVIDGDTANDGSYEWTIPAGQEEGTDFSVKITTLKGDVSATSPGFIIVQTVAALLMQFENFDRPGGVTGLVKISQSDGQYRLAVSEKGTNRIVYVDILSQTFARSYSNLALNAPSGLLAHPTLDLEDFTMTEELVIADTGNNRILRDSGTLMERQIPGGRPVAIAGRNKNFYVLNQGLGNVQVISEDLRTLLASYTLNGRLIDIEWNKEHEGFYVADAAGAGSVRVFTANFAPVRTWSLGYEPAGIACSKSGFVYVSDRKNKRIVKYTYDGKQAAVLSHANAALVPAALKAVSPEGLYVVFENSTNPAAGRVVRYNW